MSRASRVEPLVMLGTLIRWFLLASLMGAVVGLGTSVFLRGLFFSIGKTAHVPVEGELLFLPLAGLLNGLILYYGYHQNTLRGNDSVIGAVHRKTGLLPVRTGFIKPLAALITLALGGSAGKEGPCSHIGGTLASWLAQLLHLRPEVRKRLVICGISAGFASVFGTPLSGAVYGIEVLAIGRLRHDVLFPSFVAGVTAYEVSKRLDVPYSYYPFTTHIHFSELLFFKIIVLGIICGLISWLFIEAYEQVRTLFDRLEQRFHIWKPLLPMIGGILLAVLILFLPMAYLGLSLPLMDTALAGGHVPFLAFFWKILFVAITLGSGFYGGIVTPQFVIGAVAGNTFAHLLHLNPLLGAAVGMVAVVAAASNTPIAAIIMGFELFGSSIGIYTLTACVTSYLMVGHRSVYPEQLVAYPKSLWMRLEPESPIGKGDVHVSYHLLRKIKYWKSQFKHW